MFEMQDFEDNILITQYSLKRPQKPNKYACYHK